MEISDENLNTLSQYLQQTLSPDVNIRRPGKCVAFRDTISFNLRVLL